MDTEGNICRRYSCDKFMSVEMCQKVKLYELAFVTSLNNKNNPRRKPLNIHLIYFERFWAIKLWYLNYVLFWIVKHIKTFELSV